MAPKLVRACGLTQAFASARWQSQIASAESPSTANASPRSLTSRACRCRPWLLRQYLGVRSGCKHHQGENGETQCRPPSYRVRAHHIGRPPDCRNRKPNHWHIHVPVGHGLNTNLYHADHRHEHT
jgi:hypothetical protein